MITLLDKFKTVVLQFVRLHDTLNLIDEDDIRILENANMCREFNDNKFLFNSDYIERAEKFIKGE